MFTGRSKCSAVSMVATLFCQLSLAGVEADAASHSAAGLAEPPPEDIVVVPGPPSMATVFEDALARRIGPGECASAGPAVVRLGKVAAAGEGQEAALLALNGSGWGGMFLQFNSAFDASAYGQLIVRLKMPDAVRSLELKLEAPAGNGQVRNLREYPSKRDDSGWMTVSVPLADYKQVELSRLEVIGFWNPMDSKGGDGSPVACEIRIDDIRFEKKSADKTPAFVDPPKTKKPKSRPRGS